MADKIKKTDILDDVKKIDKIRKAQLLSRSLQELRSKAKEILILKRETSLLLKEIGLCESDRKKVIDYVNSTVKLSPSDKSQIKKRVTDKKNDLEGKIDKKIDDAPLSIAQTLGSYTIMNDATYTGQTLSTPTWTAYSCTNTSGDLNVTLGGQKLKM